MKVCWHRDLKTIFSCYLYLTQYVHLTHIFPIFIVSQHFSLHGAAQPFLPDSKFRISTFKTVSVISMNNDVAHLTVIKIEAADFFQRGWAPRPKSSSTNNYLHREVCWGVCLSFLNFLYWNYISVQNIISMYGQRNNMEQVKKRILLYFFHRSDCSKSSTIEKYSCGRKWLRNDVTWCR